MIETSTIVLVVIVALAILIVIKAIAIVPQQHAWSSNALASSIACCHPAPPSSSPSSSAWPTSTRSRKSRWTCPARSASRATTPSCRSTACCTSRSRTRCARPTASNYILAITQLAQTTLRSVIGKMELDRTFEERDAINSTIVSSLDEAALNWGVKVLRYEIKDLTPPNEILRSMQAQITAEREKRALIAASEGRRQEQINIATGEREAAIARPRARSRPRSTKPRARPPPCWRSPKPPPRR